MSSQGGPVMQDPLFALLAAKVWALLAGFVGAVVSALTGGGPWWQRCTRVIAGFLTSIYLTPVVVIYAADWTRVTGAALENAAAFLCGYLGVGLIDFMINEIKRRVRPSAS